MPRTRTIPDETLLDAALDIVHRAGPGALSFATLAAQVGLASSTVVQRFGTKPDLLRGALLRAWDHLDADTSSAIASAPDGRAGVVRILLELTGQYEAHDYADQLMVLREDLRDPILRARGAAWLARLVEAVEHRLRDAPGGAAGLGELVVAQWQGALVVWSFTRAGRIDTVVRQHVELLLDRALGTSNRRAARRPSPLK